MLWELYQETRISDAEQTADRAQMKADRYADEIADLKRHINRLSLACQAMWELVREQAQLTEEQLNAKILEVDNRDGRLDGKIATQVSNCAACGNPTNSKRSSCVICGVPVSRSHQFEV